MTSSAVDETGPVTQEIELDADVDHVWNVLTDHEALGDWLGADVDLRLEPGAAGRVTDAGGTRDVLVTEVADHRIVWHWWDDAGALSTVEIVATPSPTGTRVRVVETLDPAAVRPSARAGGKAMACALPEQQWAGRFGRLRAVAGLTLAPALVV